jgi:SET domain-containing protein
MPSTMPDPPACSRIDPRIEVRLSPIDRLGLFANAKIRAGDSVIVGGGSLIADAEVAELQAAFEATGAEYGCAAIDEGLNLLRQPDDPQRHGNHSCDPNLWMVDAITQAARRDISPGEELTTDYATLSVIASWRMECRCGSLLCRGVITGEDWRRPELRERYRDHFTPFINERIRRPRE